MKKIKNQLSGHFSLQETHRVQEIDSISINQRFIKNTVKLPSSAKGQFQLEE
jgi:hypothetical protein